ncbi:MAG: hypothetical protein L6E13_00050 [Firmicutes bacterium]|nr:hypothetical protein [Bacillota bacterium]
MRRRRAALRRVLSLLLAWALVSTCLLPSLALAADVTRGRDDQLRAAVARAATESYAQNAQAYLAAALDGLEELPEGDRGRGNWADHLPSLRAALETAFYDPARITEQETLEEMAQTAQAISAAWTSGNLTDPAALTALTDLLLALRQAAEAALTDARSLMGARDGEVPDEPPDGLDVPPSQWQAARNAVRQAEHAFDQALRQLEKGNAMSGAQHLVNAWRKATEALETLGHPLDPGEVTADRDGDGVADILELDAPLTGEVAELFTEDGTATAIMQLGGREVPIRLVWSKYTP